MNDSLIDQYAAGGPLLLAAIEGLSLADFAAIPIHGTWSIGQIVMHLMDSDLIASDRMKRIIAEENPTLIGFDESAFARNLFYEKLDPFIAADIFAKNRQLTTSILRSLPASAFDRTGTHSERGPVTLLTLLETYTHHLEYHLKFVREKRALLKKPLPPGSPRPMAAEILFEK